MTFTDDQKAAIDRIVYDRLQRERRKHDAEMRSLRERHAAVIEQLRHPRSIIARLRRWLM